MTIPPITKTLELTVAPERAWSAFTDRIADWWPMETHSVCEDAAAGVQFADGLLVEITPSGERHEWADVLAWEPPHRLLLRWRVNPDRTPTEVDVTFAATETGSRVTLEHRGFDDPGARESYDGGWDPVLADFAGLPVPG